MAVGLMMENTGLPRVLVCDPIHADGLELLRRFAQVEVVEGRGLTPQELEERIGQYEALIVRSRTRVPAAAIQRGERLQVIGRAGAGLDTIDVSAARVQGVEVVNAPDANTLAVAEHTFALLLGLARQLTVANSSLKAGRWEKSGLMGTGLAGKTLGIIGFGRIGRQVARRAKAFDMRVVVNQNRLTPELALSLGVEPMDLPELLRRADFVTLHVPLRASNLGLINRENLAWLKPTAYLINTSRGEIVDEAALLAALEAGQLAGAGLDVFEGEPEINQALVRHARVLATPHIGASTEDAQRDAAVTVCEQVATILRQQRTGESMALQVVPVELVVPHESYHGRRVSDLAERLVADGRLVNPPVAVAQQGKFVVLDGATRVTAFRHLGYPHIILQVVDVEKQRVQLHTWYHAVRGGSVAKLLELLAEVRGLRLIPYAVEELHKLLLQPGEPGYMVTADGQGFRLVAEELPGGGDWLDVLNRMVEAYGAWGNVDRTLTTDVDVLAAQYPDLAALFVFPQFTPERILTLAAAGRTVPAGITRFIIPGRILRLNAPLDKLASDEPLALKRHWLDKLVKEKLAYRQVRYYEEPVVLLDE